VALRGMGPEEMSECAALVRRVLAAVRPFGDRDFELDGAVRESVIARVRELCRAFPVPRYPRQQAAGTSESDGRAA
jgi:glycine hydroxymethyltransferase